MTAYRILTTPHYLRSLKTLTKRNPGGLSQIDAAVEILKVDPYNRSRRHPIKKLEDIKPGEGQYRIRSGNYRIRYDIFSQDVVLHLAADPREAYRR